MLGRIDMIVDGGEVGIGLESTIIDLTVTPPQVLRPGYITDKMLEEVLGQVSNDVTMMSAATGAGSQASGDEIPSLCAERPSYHCAGTSKKLRSISMTG